MKKHIFGFVIFGFIFASFAFAFAYFCAPPIPQIGEVNIQKCEDSMFQGDHESSPTCRKKANNFSSVVQSVQFDLNSGMITCIVKLKWNGVGELPKKVYSGVHLFTAEDDEESLYNNKQIFLDPFEKSNEVAVKIQYKLIYDLSPDTKKNLYALVEFSGDGRFDGYKEGREDISKAKQVLFIHGNSSIIRK
jgi:hypothetical protein